MWSTKIFFWTQWWLIYLFQMIISQHRSSYFLLKWNSINIRIIYLNNEEKILNKISANILITDALYVTLTNEIVNNYCSNFKQWKLWTRTIKIFLFQSSVFTPKLQLIRNVYICLFCHWNKVLSGYAFVYSFICYQHFWESNGAWL